MGKLYFAYGSNLSRKQMGWRCPKAKMVGKLMLPDHRLVFRGVADIEHHAGAQVAGGVWEITPACEAALDIYEGVKHGLYWKYYVPVSVQRGPDRVTEDMLVYVMSDYDGQSLPGRYYLDGILDGYADFDLELDTLVDAYERAKVYEAEHPRTWRWRGRGEAARYTNARSETGGPGRSTIGRASVKTRGPGRYSKRRGHSYSKREN